MKGILVKTNLLRNQEVIADLVLDLTIEKGMICPGHQEEDFQGLLHVDTEGIDQGLQGMITDQDKEIKIVGQTISHRNFLLTKSLNSKKNLM